MTRPHKDDRGLDAVRRVREVREQDSRLGLQQALSEERAVTERLEAYVDRLSHTEFPALSTPSELFSLHIVLRMLGAVIGETRTEVETAVGLSAYARARWTADRARVSAVDHLLQQRAEARQAEADRRTAAELDDLAAQRWQRTHDQESHPA